MMVKNSGTENSFKKVKISNMNCCFSYEVFFFVWFNINYCLRLLLNVYFFALIIVRPKLFLNVSMENLLQLSS